MSRFTGKCSKCGDAITSRKQMVMMWGGSSSAKPTLEDYKVYCLKCCRAVVANSTKGCESALSSHSLKRASCTSITNQPYHECKGHCELCCTDPRHKPRPLAKPTVSFNTLEECRNCTRCCSRTDRFGPYSSRRPSPHCMSNMSRPEDYERRCDGASRSRSPPPPRAPCISPPKAPCEPPPPRTVCIAPPEIPYEPPPPSCSTPSMVSSYDYQPEPPCPSPSRISCEEYCQRCCDAQSRRSLHGGRQHYHSRHASVGYPRTSDVGVCAKNSSRCLLTMEELEQIKQKFLETKVKLGNLIRCTAPRSTRSFHRTYHQKQNRADHLDPTCSTSNQSNHCSWQPERRH